MVKGFLIVGHGLGGLGVKKLVCGERKEVVVWEIHILIVNFKELVLATQQLPEPSTLYYGTSSISTTAMDSTNTSSNISLLLFTFNCAKALQPYDIVQRAVTAALSKATSSPPQILVFGFEELTSILEGSFGLLNSNLSTIQIGVRAAIDSSFAQSQVQYKLTAESHVGAIATLVYTLDKAGSSNSKPLSVVDVATATSHRGYIYSSLKGAAAVRLIVKEGLESSESEAHEFTFVDAHLAANEGQIADRNNDFYGIVTSLGFPDGYGAYKPRSHLFFMGDLNYRASFQQSTDSAAQPLHSDAIDLSENVISGENHYEDLKKTDELYHVMKSKQSFYGFTEAPVTFAATYKFTIGTSKYNTKRIPSWCDRILYLPYSKPVEILDYSSLPDISTSDHKPVYLLLNVPKSAPIPVFETDTKNPYRVSILPELLPSGQSVDVSLSPHHGYYHNLGATSDFAIGWALYLSTTWRGRSYSALGLFVLTLILYLL